MEGGGVWRIQLEGQWQAPWSSCTNPTYPILGTERSYDLCNHIGNLASTIKCYEDEMFNGFGKDISTCRIISRKSSSNYTRILQYLETPKPLSHMVYIIVRSSRHRHFFLPIYPSAVWTVYRNSTSASRGYPGSIDNTQVPFHLSTLAVLSFLWYLRQFYIEHVHCTQDMGSEMSFSIHRYIRK